jgi:hypothetical protein
VLTDPDPRVRRRALVHLVGEAGLDAGPLCLGLLDDSDPTTRRLAYAALSGTRDPQAALRLPDGMSDPEPAVRKAAVMAAESVFGCDAARLLALPGKERSEAAAALKAYLAAALDRLAPEGRLLDRSRLSTLLPARWQKSGDESADDFSRHCSFERIREVLMIHLGGCTPGDLAAELAVDEEAMAEIIRVHERAGRVVRRGRRLCLP